MFDLLFLWYEQEKLQLATVISLFKKGQITQSIILNKKYNLQNT